MHWGDGRSRLTNLHIFVTRQPASVDVSVRFSLACKHRSEWFKLNNPKKSLQKGSALPRRSFSICRPSERSDRSREQKSGKLAWKKIGSYSQIRNGKSSQYSSRLAKGQSSYKWQSIYKVSAFKETGWEQTDFNYKSVSPGWTKDCKSCSVHPVPTRVWTDVIDWSESDKYCRFSCCKSSLIAKGQPQKKGISPAVVRQR